MFAHTKQTGVIVLGKDDAASVPGLKQLRDLLRSQRYEATLIKDLAEIPMMSNEEKVRLWAMTSRFCVMLDDAPAGHIAEYVFLRDQRTILALLRPCGTGSTYMIGDDPLVDLNYVNVFEYDASPLSVMGSAISWAEEVAKKREAAYGTAYPWRRA
jgi:hypothetical protein